MTPVEAPELVTARIRELVATYAVKTAEAERIVEIKEGA
jgi:hypothetical protein